MAIYNPQLIIVGSLLVAVGTVFFIIDVDVCNNVLIDFARKTLTLRSRNLLNVLIATETVEIGFSEIKSFSTKESPHKFTLQHYRVICSLQEGEVITLTEFNYSEHANEVSSLFKRFIK